MTLKAAIAELDEKLHDLRRTLDDLLWAVTQGLPETAHGHALLDHYESATTDMLGLVQEAMAATDEARKMTGGEIDLAGARVALVTGQERFNQIAQRYYAELVSPEAMGTLSSLVQEDGEEWQPWVNGVMDGLESCRQPLYDVSQALFQGWQELTEGPGLVSVSVKAASTGQKINLAREKSNRDSTST